MFEEGLGFEVARLNKLDGNGNLKAFADVSFAGCFIVKGFRVIEGKNGLFVGMPREQGKNGNWYNSAYPLDKKTRDKLQEVVLGAYNHNQ